MFKPKEDFERLVGGGRDRRTCLPTWSAGADDSCEPRALDAASTQRTYDSIDRPKMGTFSVSDMSKDGPSLQERKGCFLERWQVFAVAGLFVGGMLLVGLLVGFFHQPKGCSTPDIISGGLQANSTKGPPTDAEGTTALPPTIQPTAIPTKTTDSSASANGTKKEHPNVRLPRSVAPDSYYLELQTHLDTLQYTGVVTIHLNVLENTDNVTLHTFNLTVNNISVDAKEVHNHTVDERLQFLIIFLDTSLQANTTHNLTIHFNGTLRDNLDGFYYAKYDSDGREVTMATTQFEAVSARTAFPCFDEPGLKAVFNITLVRWNNVTSISNMPIYKQEPRGSDWTADYFLPSPKMSTYLLAFVVSELKYMVTDNDDMKMTVWARPEILPSAAYAGNIGPRILKHYEKFFDTAYPLNKTDMVAAPDFNAGAMENWGLIIYRENSMLFDASTTSAQTKKKVAQTVAHELAHQWFGNLVTPKWWDDLWLNEGFASYVEYLGTAFVEPTWEMDKLIVVDFTHDVMELDALKSSHPVSVPVYDPVEINEIFDQVSYEKGAAIIRMMDKFLGRDTFLKGLKSYLNAKKYDNAETSELWYHLTKIQGNSSNQIDVAKIMDKWAKQTGFPLVTVERNYENNSVTVRQKRFLLQRSNDTDTNIHDGECRVSEEAFQTCTPSSEIHNRYLRLQLNESQMKPSTGDGLWDVPLTWCDNTSDPNNLTTQVQRWFSEAQDTFSIPNVPSSSWIIFNNEETGFYRVNYDPQNWAMIIDQLHADHERINVVNRAQILNDAFNLARVGEVNYSLALNTTSYLAKEDDYLPWTTAFSAIHLLHTMLARSDIFGLWKKYVIGLVEKQYERLGWDEKPENESILIQFHRAEILQWACNYGHPDCVAKAKEKFFQWKNNSKPVPPNMRRVVYCTGIAEGSDDDWDYMWNRYLKEKSPSEGITLLRALSCSRQQWILTKFMRLALEPSKGIRLQDSVTALTVVASNFGREIYFNFVRENYDTMYQRFGNLTFTLSYVVERFADVLNTRFELQELQAFSKQVEGKMGTAKRSFNQSIESVQANIEFMDNNYDEICAWLTDRFSN